MVKINNIYNRLLEFIQIFIIKYKYENVGLIKKMKIDSRLNLDVDDERWCKLFLYKSCYNHCAKFILLKKYEDSGQVTGKLNSSGLEKWRVFVKNILDDYKSLYYIAIQDIKNDGSIEIRNAYKESDYDIFCIDDELSEYLVNDFANINFSTLSNKDISQLFKLVYTLEQREEFALEKFYKKAPALDYILKYDKEA